MNQNKTTSREPLFHVVKRPERSGRQMLLFRLGAVALSILAGGLFILAIGYNPIEIYGTILNGAFRSKIAVQSTIKITIPLCISALGATLEAVNITEMRDGIYIAELVFGDDRVVSARPSDAVALAVRTGAPIYGAEELLDEVGIEIPDEQEDEVEKFREFLDQISPEDFGAGSGSGGGPA